MFRWVKTRPHVVAYATAAWSLLYGLAGAYWALGGDGYPFAKVDDDHSSASLLEPSRAAVVGPFIAAIGIAGAVLAVVMAKRPAKKWWLVLAWIQAGVFGLLIPDYTLLAVVAFSPLLIVFAFTGVPGPQDGIGDILYWHRVNLILVFVWGALWALTAVTAGRTKVRRVPYARAARIGRIAVWVSLAATIPYDTTRLAWYFGWPLGITDDFLKMMQDTPGMLEIGLGLAAASAVGALLTHGLVARWGEVWPRWVFWRAGRPIHPLTAVIPAGIVAIAVIPAGLMGVRMIPEWENWGTTMPATLFAVWGMALGTAAWAYWVRRTGDRPELATPEKEAATR
ncbi:hypothetical protein Afil01_45770 [Actinorhabdospora filicis]|uniref:Uncharacterized protein n=1 Tax=Actinorhabdospora filicis TaxID=1785913 RepID=A0A9W6SPS7_9ACTN|nr:NYN domain-containing protein [Actinorhabdospora filicis]GLZ79770.1 hypothetical protein Afil01_45770 [Actinorhabdospora filicis]